ncbi:MAG: hypothetical protein ACRYFW_12355 [Janthinobacterium lividum]
MRSLRHHLLRHRWLACWIVAAALLMRIVVPAGYMPMASGGAIAIALCPGDGPVPAAMAMAGMTDPHALGDHGRGDHGKAGAPCDYSSLSAPSLGGADAILLALALAFVVAAALRRPAPRRLARLPYLRPPLRGPPAVA